MLVVTSQVELLLSHGYCLAEDEHEQRVMKPYPPLGILYLSSYLKARGRSVEVHDTTFSTVQAFADRLESNPPKVVGLSSNLMTRATVLRMISIARSAGAWVVLGGPEAAPNAEAYLQRGAHVVVEGEGEATTDQLLEHLEANGSDGLEAVDGVIFLGHDGEVVRTRARALIQPLDSVPWPDRDGINMNAYFEAWRGRHGHASASLVTARGCPYTCTWCSHAVYGRSYRRRSVADVADEVEHLLERWAPEQLWYTDDVFTLNREWILRYAAELKSRGVRVPFECISRADRINEQVADALAEMGCYRLWIGSESGSQKVLDAMQRLTSPEDVQEKTAMLQARGILVGMFVMLGNEEEDEGDLELTVQHLKKANPDVVLTTVAYPIAGTEYHRKVEDRILTDLPWEQRTDRDLRISGRHSAEYYRHASKWIINEAQLSRSRRAGCRDPIELFRTFFKARRGRFGMFMTRSQKEEQGLEAKALSSGGGQ